MTFSLLDVLGLLIVYQALVFVGLLSFDRHSKPLFIRVLVWICLLIGIHFVYMFAERFLVGDHLLLGPVFGLSYGPAYYLYTLSLTDREVHPMRYSLALLPAAGMGLVVIFFRNWTLAFTPWIGLLVTGHFLGYLTFSLRTIFRYRKQLKEEISDLRRIDLRWLEAIIYLQVFVLLVTLLESVYQTTGRSEPFVIAIYGLVLVLVHCFYHLGLRQVRRFPGIAPAAVSEYRIAAEQMETYRSRLETYLRAEEPFLEFELSLTDLATRLDISKRNLSHVINQTYGQNFYDLINGFRIDRAKEALAATDQPIKTIMYDSGFSNKASFNAIFKKATGLTPTQYRRARKNRSANA